jgi:hypothetical protein
MMINDTDFITNKLPLKLNQKDAEDLKRGLDEIERIASDRELLVKAGVINPEDSESISSFDDAFPNYIRDMGDVSKDEKLVFDDLEMSNSKVLEKLFENKTALDFFKSFRDKGTNEERAKIQDILNILENTEFSNGEYKPLGNFGDMTINEALKQGFKIAGPLRESLDKVGINGSYIGIGGSLITFGIMFNGICKAHSNLVYKGSNIPNSKEWELMSDRLKVYYEKTRLREIKNFKLIAAPMLVISLFVIKQLTFTRNINVSFESSTETDVSTSDIKQSFSIITFLKKLPNFIGKVVIGTFVLIIINYFLTTYSINLSDPFYLKCICIFCLIISSIMFLNYFIQYFIYLYFSMHKNISIPKSLPKRIYRLLDELNTLSDFKPFIRTHFYLNFLIYGVLILLFIILLSFFY